MIEIKEVWEWFGKISAIRELINKVKQTSVDFYRRVKEYRNLPSEIMEAWPHIKTLYYIQKDWPKSERDGSQNAIASAYEEHINTWVKDKLLPVKLLFKLVCYLLLIYIKIKVFFF